MAAGAISAVFTMFHRQHSLYQKSNVKPQRNNILTLLSACRRGDLPFNVRRAIPRGALESDEESEAKTETPEAKPE